MHGITLLIDKESGNDGKCFLFGAVVLVWFLHFYLWKRIAKEYACTVSRQPAELSSHLLAYGSRNHIQTIKLVKPSH